MGKMEFCQVAPLEKINFIKQFLQKQLVQSII